MLDNVYRNEIRFLEHLQAQAANLPQYKDEVGATANDQTEIPQDAAVLEFLIETANAADDYKKTAYAVKAGFMSSKSEPPVGDFMTAPPTVPPFPVLAGALKRARDRDQRFLRAATITEAAKVALDLIGEESGPIDLNTFQPTLEIFVAQTGYLYTAVIGNRGASDQFEVQVRPKGGNWTSAGNFTGKSADIVFAPQTPGEPAAIEIRVQLKRRNANYGQLSDIIAVTVNP